MSLQSDHGYSSDACSMRCVACGSYELYCCDGHGGRLSFDDWADAVADKAISIGGLSGAATPEAPYAEMYQEGLSVMAAVDRALS